MEAGGDDPLALLVGGDGEMDAELALALAVGEAMAWGDEGHKIVAQIATHHLTPAARQKAFAMLARWRGR